MPRPDKDQTIDYIEFQVTDMAATKAFFAAAFGWTFEDYGPRYTAFKDGRLDGGFEQSDSPVTHAPTAPLIVLYATDLEATRQRVVDAGGTIVKDIFSFPGGRRFRFREPSGNELAVWSDPAE